MSYVRRVWKEALARDRGGAMTEVELKKKVAKGRFMLREMVGVIQLKKYRVMKSRYIDDDPNAVERRMENLVAAAARERSK